MHKRALEPERYARGTEETILYSAPVEAFLATSAWNRLYGEATDVFRTVGPNNLFPGPRAAGARRRGRGGARAAAGKAEPRGRRSRRAARWPRSLVALGPRVRAFGHDLGPAPWGLLRDALPVFQMIRVTSRAGAFVALPLAMLAAMALDRLRPRPLVLAGVVAIALAETLIVPIPMPRWSQLVDTREGRAARLPVARRPAGTRPDRRTCRCSTCTASSGSPRSTRASTWSTRRCTGSRSSTATRASSRGGTCRSASCRCASRRTSS